MTRNDSFSTDAGRRTRQEEACKSQGTVKVAKKESYNLALKLEVNLHPGVPA